MECSICLETCIQPVELPCGHIFCFLCVKGVADRYQNCAMCRKPIPEDYFENPVLVSSGEPLDLIEFDGGYQWFYEGKNGWWLYDPRTSSDLEEAFKLGQPTCQLLIAGHLYYIDFIRMVQYRSAEPKKRRRIKRDAIQSTITKGIAGLKSFEVLSTNYLGDKPSAPPMSPPLPAIPTPSTLSPRYQKLQISSSSTSHLTLPPPPPPPPSPALPISSLSLSSSPPQSSSSSSSPSNGLKNHRKKFLIASPFSWQSSSLSSSPSSTSLPSSSSWLSPSNHFPPPTPLYRPPSIGELINRLSSVLGNDSNLLR
ncbi:E3 ubiquitin-protein ligase RNF146-like [Panonychus citri]|uniref:E3 ubiquitin-protein ligase RNF146-like n=1 Tax=Panonychus citri TaxID=50023 RepID=UPI002307C93B|nr:E3 ubiquitin-protein ligase RNF146-like [Panonychus citri]